VGGLAGAPVANRHRGGSWCGGWLDGRRSVTIATALGWSGALGESVGAWFGAHLCGHRTEAARMSTSRITALPRRSRRQRALRGPCRLPAGRVDVHSSGQLDQRSARAARWTTRSPTQTPADDEPAPAQPIRLTPLGEHRPRPHTDHRLSGTPKRPRHPNARNRPGPPHDQRPTTRHLNQGDRA
jgi:hypothetical protein